MLKKYLSLGIVSVFLAAQSSLSCSLMEIDKKVMQELMQEAVAVELSIDKSEIPADSFTAPEVTFLHGLGTDCSGLDAAFFSSAYFFTKVYSDKTCTHRGVVINKGYDLNGAKIVQDSSSCLPLH